MKTHLLLVTLLAGALAPVPAATPDATVDDGLRHALFAVGLRHAKAASGANPAGCLCLAQENGADPPPEMMMRLTTESGLVLYPLRECVRRRVRYDDPRELGGFSNVLVIGEIQRHGLQQASAVVRFFGHSTTVALTWKQGQWESEAGLVGAPPAFPTPTPTPDPRVNDAMRYAVFAEGLHVAKVHESFRPRNPSGCYCVAQELRRDPAAEVVERLAKEFGVRVYSSSECERLRLSYAEPGSLGGFANLILIVEIRLESPSRAVAEVRMFGGSGLVILTLKDGQWKGECCEGGLVG